MTCILCVTAAAPIITLSSIHTVPWSPAKLLPLLLCRASIQARCCMLLIFHIACKEVVSPTSTKCSLCCCRHSTTSCGRLLVSWMPHFNLSNLLHPLYAASPATASLSSMRYPLLRSRLILAVSQHHLQSQLLAASRLTFTRSLASSNIYSPLLSSTSCSPHPSSQPLPTPISTILRRRTSAFSEK
ncbi:hypothetical protein IWX47DRAFT_358378 [Phyllosticta citricarpa]